MKKSLFILLSFLVLFCNSVFAAKYTEDNAAYWYQKAFDDLKKVYESDKISTSEDAIKINGIKSLEDFNKLTPETKKVFEESLKGFLEYLKKAREQKKCVFWEMPLNDKDEKDTQFQDHRMFFRGFRMANALAWYAISIGKPDIAGAIWQTMLNISVLVSENNLILIRTTAGGVTVKLVIPSLDNYFENGASDAFKAKFINYLKKWPKSMFDIGDAIKVYYEYQKNNVELYANDQKFLAGFFGADLRYLINDPSTLEPRIEENPECASQRRIVAGALEMYQMDESEGEVKSIMPDLSGVKNKRKVEMIWKHRDSLKKKIAKLEKEPKVNNEKPKEKKEDSFGDEFDEDVDFNEEPNIEDYKSELEAIDKRLKELGVNIEDSEGSEDNKPVDFSNMAWDEIISLMERSRYLRGNENYTCPNNGKRTIKTIKRRNEILYEITCDCSKVINPMDDFKPDSEPMRKARIYKETLLENDKKQLHEYYEMLLKIDHTKPMTDKEMLALNSVEILKYKNNVILLWLGLGYDRFRKSFESYQKVIDDFLKKYDKN